MGIGSVGGKDHGHNKAGGHNSNSGMDPPEH